MNAIEFEVERVRHGLSKTDIAEYLGISREAYRKKETGRSSFTDDEKVRLAKLFGLSCSRFCLIFFEEMLPIGINE